MSAFDEYKTARAAMTAAETRAEAIVKSIQTTLAPLFDDWKNCYIADLNEIPASLTAIIDGNRRSGINVTSFQWAQLQACMAQYVDSVPAARRRCRSFDRRRRAPLAGQ